MRSVYGAARRTPARARVVVTIAESDLSEIDRWAIETGKLNRSDALRDLLIRGLKTLRPKPSRASAPAQA